MSQHAQRGMPMRLLVACQRCHRQYDATGYLGGSRFHCHCGSTIEVPRAGVHDAAVVRCSSCGGPRSGGEAACRYCGADFSLHEQDLQTICPSCLTRVGNRARFCHSCGTRIRVDGRVGEPTDSDCPACGAGHVLHSRSLGKPPLPLLECPRCAGLWLGEASFEQLAERARTLGRSGVTGEAPAAVPAPHPARGAAGAGPLYRTCPVCRGPMHRRNFGGKSAVIIDTCRAHGIWFDAQELETLLDWIREGGERHAERRNEEGARHAERQERLQRQLEQASSARREAGQRASTSGGDASVFADLLGTLFDA